MKLYRIKDNALIENAGTFYQAPETDWDTLFNTDNLYNTLKNNLSELTIEPQGRQLITNGILAPIVGQELWASGVTYLRSKQGRQEESKEAGGGDFYQRVYEADRPELFFKALARRVAGHNQNIRIRADSTWDVPEPELVLAINAKGDIIGYTIGNDVSSRSIEGENPLYLPQAKTYDGSAALGPCIKLTNNPLPQDTNIHLSISRDGKVVFNDSIAIDQITRKFEDLVAYLYRECSFPAGAFLMTGTGIVPGNDFTLQSRDRVTIEIDGIGSLTNEVA